MQRITPIRRLFPGSVQHAVAGVLHFRFQSAPANVLFWLGFIALNAALFLPAFFLNADSTHFWPTTNADNPRTFLFRLLVWRENLDIFRLNLEVTLMLASWLYIARVRRRSTRFLFFAFYLVMVFYYAYESAMLYLYRVNPVFFSDYFFARDGLGFLLENTQITPARLSSGLAVLLAAILLLVAGFGYTLHQIAAGHINRLSRILVGAIAAAAIMSAVVFQGGLAQPMMVTSSGLFKIAENIQASIQAHQSLIRFGDIEVEDAYDYAHFTLTETPDIYLIFIESYGSVLYKRPDYYEQYAQLAAETYRQLADNDWRVATALSEAPTWGGGSWLAYTSTLFGLHIENHPQYLMLLEKYALDDEGYPHLGAYLQTQGYQFVWLSSLAEQLSARQWERYDRFYGYDRLFRYVDLDYTGPHYGWGPSPPDQYALNFAYTHAIQPDSEGERTPTFLFFISQNSHFPWAPIPPILEDWRDFLELDEEDDPIPVEFLEHDALRARYMDSIVYSLEMLTDFILREGDENAIYILLGDHQPPRVSRRSDGLDTPVHIISRNTEFIEGLTHYGFIPDTLFLDAPEPLLRHEGLYSLLVRQLIEYYGTDRRLLPTYHQEGFMLEELFEEALDSLEGDDEHEH